MIPQSNDMKPGPGKFAPSPFLLAALKLVAYLVGGAIALIVVLFLGLYIVCLCITGGKSWP